MLILPLSLDTVVFAVESSASFSADVKSVFSSFDAAGNSKTGFFRYYLRPNKFFQLPSNYSAPVFSDLGGRLVFQFSLPKLIYGHSAAMVAAEDLPLIFESIQRSLIDWGINRCPSWDKWLVNRLDFSFNFLTPSAEHVGTHLSNLSRLRYGTRNPSTDPYGRSVAHWSTKQRTVKFYSKYLEMLADKRNNFETIIDNPALPKIIRYEFGLRKQAVKSEFSISDEGSLTIARVLARLKSSPSMLGQTGTKFVNRLGRRGLPVSLVEAREKIRTLRKSAHLLDFLDQVIDQGFEATREFLIKNQGVPGRNKFNRYVTRLGEVGVSIDDFDLASEKPSISELRTHEILRYNLFGIQDVLETSDPFVMRVREYFNAPSEKLLIANY